MLGEPWAGGAGVRDRADLAQPLRIAEGTPHRVGDLDAGRETPHCGDALREALVDLVLWQEVGHRRGDHDGSVGALSAEQIAASRIDEEKTDQRQLTLEFEVY